MKNKAGMDKNPDYSGVELDKLDCIGLLLHMLHLL